MLPARVLLVSAALAALASAESCSSYSSRFGRNLQGICVCSAASCDEVSNEYLSLPSDRVGVFRTSLAGDRLTYTTVPLENASLPVTGGEIRVNSSFTYQTLTGFGGAFTDATTVNAGKLTPELQEKLLDAYFGDNGIQYTLGRVPIGPSDFSEFVYSYNPVEGDLDMKYFSIDVDKFPYMNKLAFLKRALAKSSRPISLFASPWMPPAWMTRDKQVQNSHIIGEPGEPYWKALALYYKKFLDEYKKEGVSFWAMTTQNEPNLQAGFRESKQLRFNSTQERDFIKKDLGPMLKASHPDVKLIIMDDQKYTLANWHDALTDPESRQYISGVGVHWYNALDFTTVFNGPNTYLLSLADFHAAFPDVLILPTEASEGFMEPGKGTGAGVRFQEPDIMWKRAENYVNDIIGDLSYYAVGWTDFNMVLDTTGGPTWAGSPLDAPILIDEKSGEEFYKQPMYYFLGHFAKFLPAGSKRIRISINDPNKVTALRQGFVTPSGQVVVVILNMGTRASEVKVRDLTTARVATVSVPARSIQTVLFPAPSPTNAA